MARSAEVKNAADPEQVNDAARRERRQQRDDIEALIAVMSTYEGRRRHWVLLKRAGIYHTVFDQSGAKTAYNAGRQDYGHELIAELVEECPELYLQMEQEARTRDRRSAVETDAAHTARAEQGVEA